MISPNVQLKKNNPIRQKFPDHPYKIVIIGSRSGKQTIYLFKLPINPKMIKYTFI